MIKVKSDERWLIIKLEWTTFEARLEPIRVGYLTRLHSTGRTLALSTTILFMVEVNDSGCR